MSKKLGTKEWVRDHIDSHMTGGHVWPDMAEYAIKYCQAGAKESAMEFFLNKDDMDDWLLECAGNGTAYQCYVWDFGPNAMPKLHQHVDWLKLTAAEKGALA